jgi:hypothetical protein
MDNENVDAERLIRAAQDTLEFDKDVKGLVLWVKKYAVEGCLTRSQLGQV